MRVLRVGAALLGTALALSGHTAHAFTTRPGPFRAVPRFAVTYSGSGRWATSYHAEPSDGGGKHDTDTARDSSTQSWSERFAERLVVRPCGRGHCAALVSLDRAGGRTSATGHIDHIHLDGLYPQLNASISCSVRASTPAGTVLASAIDVQYARHGRALAITALEPVSDALTLLPTACPGQGDSLDGLFDNYYTPGFSFSPVWGSGRWFTSATVNVPASVLQHASRITIALSDTRVNQPPRDCAVPDPSWQRCRTGGAWAGTVTLKRSTT